MDYQIIIIKISITFVLSLLFGLERQFSNKPIGFGTFTFVALGSCGLSIIAVMLNESNPLPLLSGIVTGIGFLGAGALIRTSDKIFGFTSAASIWVFAIIGLCIGTGHYLIAGCLYVFVWMIIIIDKFFEIKGLGLYQKKITLQLKKAYTKVEIKSILNAKKYKTLHIHFDKVNSIYTYVLIIENKKQHIDKLPEILMAHNDIIEFTLD